MYITQQQNIEEYGISEYRTPMDDRVQYSRSQQALLKLYRWLRSLIVNS
jgi:hypothetical protein